MLKFSILLLLFAALAWAAKPMEPLTNYNVILVHGAADNQGDNGFECEGALVLHDLLTHGSNGSIYA